MRSYNTRHLQAVGMVSNVSTVIEQIDIAATKAAVLMRAVGITLPGIDLPTVDDIDQRLRELVCDAYNNLYFPDGDGIANDDLFEVDVEATRDGDRELLDVQIFFRLV